MSQWHTKPTFAHLCVWLPWKGGYIWRLLYRWGGRSCRWLDMTGEKKGPVECYSGHWHRLWKNSQREQSVENKVLFALQERRGAWCGEIHQPWGLGALNFYWIIIGFKHCGGCCCVAPGLLGRCNRRLQFVPMLPSASGCREQLVLFLLSSNFPSVVVRGRGTSSVE